MLFHTGQTLVEDREVIALLEKSEPIRGEKLIIRTGKERVRNMFDVKVVQLMEFLGRDRKYGIGLVGSFGSVGGRVCDRHQKVFNLISSFRFIIIVIYPPYI